MPSQFIFRLAIHGAYSYIFHPCSLLPYFPLLHFPPLQSAPAFSTPAFSTPCNYTRAAFSTAVFSVAPIKHPAKISNLLTDRSSHLLVSYTRSVARCVGHFTFWISLSLKISLNPKYELRPKISQKVKLFFVWSHRFASDSLRPNFHIY